MKLLTADESINNPRLHLQHYKESRSIMGKCFYSAWTNQINYYHKNLHSTKSKV